MKVLSFYWKEFFGVFSLKRVALLVKVRFSPKRITARFFDWLLPSGLLNLSGNNNIWYKIEALLFLRQENKIHHDILMIKPPLILLIEWINWVFHKLADKEESDVTIYPLVKVLKTRHSVPKSLVAYEFYELCIFQ